MVMVNKKLKEFRNLVKTGKIDIMLWCVHFGDKRPDKCKCRDCVDYMSGDCSGGMKSFECMKFNSLKEMGWVGGIMGEAVRPPVCINFEKERRRRSAGPTADDERV